MLRYFGIVYVFVSIAYMYIHHTLGTFTAT